MLRNEASANDGTDASFLSMTVRIKKIGMYSRTIGTEGARVLLFKNLTLLMLKGWLSFVSPSLRRRTGWSSR
ncbi:hypothetical protein [Pedobacter borealis]|uniref:hypothetical protein n=1 Tax=Pedobacter borealis TaxID=475254 RepID=UPI0004935B3D|nr:hypothetical protein [Pedobacter borealis]